MNKKRHTEQDYINLADSRGFVWLGPFPDNALTKTGWQCSIGHIWNARYNDISGGNGCPQCARHSESDYMELADKRQFTWLGPFPQNAKTKTSWECGNGHVWDARFSDISSGYGCPECARNKARLSESDYRKLADRRGFIWIGPLPHNIQTCTKWECGNGHIWNASFGGIYSGNGCPRCSGKARVTDSDYRAIGQDRGIEWLGPFPNDSHMKTAWKCSRGHIWLAAYHTVKRSGCRKCYEMDNRGDKHPSFRGGILAFRKKYGDGFNERRKKEVRMRDNYTCMLTGEYLGGRKKSPDVHHVVSARIAPREWKNSVHNLIVLSRPAHIWAEKNPRESIPLLRKKLYETYGYDFSDMQDYDISELKITQNSSTKFGFH